MISGKRLGFGIAAVGDGDDALFFGDQISKSQIQPRFENLGTTRVAEVALNAFELLADYLHQAHRVGQDADQLADLGENLLVLAEQFFVLKPRQAVQAQVKNGLGLFRRQVILAVAQTVLRIETFRTAGVGTGALDHRLNCTRFPLLGDQRFFGFGRRRRGLDQRNHGIDVGQCDCLAFENMPTLTRLAQLIDGPAGHDFTAMADEGFEQLF